MRTQDFYQDEQTEYEQVLDLIRENPSITIGELCDRMYYTENKIKKILRTHKDNGTLTRIGSGRSGYWKIN